MNTKTATKTAKTQVKTSNTAPVKSKDAVKKTEKIVFLAEGITGKNLVANKIDTNNSVKAENTSFSFCLKQVIKHDKGFCSSFVKFKETDCTPANLLPLRKGKEGANGKYSAWLIMTLIRRYYANKK